MKLGTLLYNVHWCAIVIALQLLAFMLTAVCKIKQYVQQKVSTVVFYCKILKHTNKNSKFKLL